MGAWSNKFRISDQSLDYLLTITDRLEREIAYWMTLEQISSSGHWLNEVVSVLELMLLFEQYDSRSNAYLSQETTVQRWRGTFLSVWDSDWREDDQFSYPHAFKAPEYRQQHRPVVIELFDRLESIARVWMYIDKNHKDSGLPLAEFHYSLPYFSITRWTGQHGQAIHIARFTEELIRQLAKDIIHWFSFDEESEMVNLTEIEIWVAAEILGFLSETYEHTPLATEEMVRKWRETSIEIMNEREWNEANLFYQNVIRVFDDLEAVAQKYPPETW